MSCIETMNTTIEKGCFTHHNYSNVGNVTLLNPRERQREIHFLMKSKNMYILTIKVKLQNISRGACSQTNNSNSKYFPFSVILGQFDISFLIFLLEKLILSLLHSLWSWIAKIAFSSHFAFVFPTGESFHFPISFWELSKCLGHARAVPINHFIISALVLVVGRFPLSTFCFSAG